MWKKDSNETYFCKVIERGDEGEQDMRTRKIARETWVIALIGILDLMTTILFIRHHGAEEANPLFHRYWQMGIPVFVLAKLVLLLIPLAVLEWARQRRPRFVRLALRVGITAYVAMYGVGFTQLNSQAVATKKYEKVAKEAGTAPGVVEIRSRLAVWHADQSNLPEESFRGRHSSPPDLVGLTE